MISQTKTEGNFFMEENIVFNSEDVQKNKVFGVLAYLGILFLVPLLAAKDSQYARFHTNQGIMLFILDVVLGICSGIISAILAFMPIVGWGLIPVVNGAVGILILVLTILGIVNACSGEPKKLPIIGNITILS